MCLFVKNLSDSSKCCRKAIPGKQAAYKVNAVSIWTEILPHAANAHPHDAREDQGKNQDVDQWEDKSPGSSQYGRRMAVNQILAGKVEYEIPVHVRAGKKTGGKNTHNGGIKKPRLTRLATEALRRSHMRWGHPGFAEAILLENDSF
jgi:hypothetical protein